jgi:DnaJ-class molecular chaperone
MTWHQCEKCWGAGTTSPREDEWIVERCAKCGGHGAIWREDTDA